MNGFQIQSKDHVKNRKLRKKKCLGLVHGFDTTEVLLKPKIKNKFVKCYCFIVIKAQNNFVCFINT